ncbi:hypothetical protein QBC37DRAFT_389539 [Rhypophila decipiens]|uniref:Uncharacterized protein n=1 Tax=Rhypophila decipiens TaxID=261697 RepID=A0AAN6Y7Q8_9PEZI|nr:hypothetical protein QBC37DRAFT_389539 [Rhypophila decipiens]
MAPRRGGGSGGGSSGSSSSGSSSSCGSYSTYPCSSELNFMYGVRWRPLWSQGENYGQLIMACIWAAALLISLFCLLRAVGLNKKTAAPSTATHPGEPVPTPAPTSKPPRGSGWPLQTGMALLFVSFVFLAVRYGIISSEANVLIGYRYESSIVVLLERLALPLIFFGLSQLATPPTSSRVLMLLKVPYLLFLAAYTILNMAYLILDFLISASAVEFFKEEWSWRLGDRDFALIMTKGMVEAAKTNGLGTGFAPGHVREMMYDYEDEPAYLNNRWIQIKIGVAADAVAVVLALVLLGLVVAAFGFGGSGIHKRGRRLGLLLVAAVGMYLSTLFALVVSAHFVHHNFGVITEAGNWFDFILSYGETEPDYYGLTDYIPPEGFLTGYRTTVDGFPVVQAVLWPLGVVLACIAAVSLVRAEAKEQARDRIVDGGLYYDKREERHGITSL